MSHAQGVHGSGERGYTADQRAALVGVMQAAHCGRAHAIKVAALAEQLGYGGRTVRAILSDVDGVEFVLGGGDAGYYVARSRDETFSMTGRLGSQAKRMLARVERRDAAASTLPTAQPGLF